MSVTTLDPRIALIVLDLQAGIVALPTVHPTDVIGRRAAQLAGAFRSHDLPVVLVTVAGGAPGRTDAVRAGGDWPVGWTDLIPELDAHPSDLQVVKNRWGAFHDTDLEGHLRNLGVTQVVLAGISTSMAVESTARHAFEKGFHVVLAADAMTDMDADAHHNSVTRIFPKLGERGAAAEIIELLGVGR